MRTYKRTSEEQHIALSDVLNRAKKLRTEPSPDIAGTPFISRAVCASQVNSNSQAAVMQFS